MAQWSEPNRRGAAGLGEVLEAVLANLDLRTRFREHLAVLAWPDIVGRVVAAHTLPETVRDGVLIVATDTAAWAQELQMRQRELLELVSRRIGPAVIREIHFRPGRTRGKPRRKEVRPAPRPVEMKLSAREEREIAEAAARVQDGELREKVERALHSLVRLSHWRKEQGWRRCRRCGQWQRVGRRWCASCSYGGKRRRQRG